MLSQFGHTFWPREPHWSQLETARRRVFIVMAAITLTLGLMELFTGMARVPMMFGSVGVLSGGCIVVIAFVRRWRSIRLPSLMMLSLAFITVMGYVIKFGLAAGAFPNIYLLIIATTLLLGPRYGVVVAASAVGLMVWAYVTYHMPGAVAPKDIDDVFTQHAAATALGIVACCWIYGREMMDTVGALDRERGRALAASQAKSDFLANMSHEVRTPLNGIMGMAQILETKALDAEEKECVDVILDSSDTLLAVVNDVLDLSKIEAGKLEISPAPGNLAEGLQRLTRLWQPLAQEKNLSLTMQISDDIPATLQFDELRVRQCVSNLVSNAIKFTHAGGVKVVVSRPETAPETNPETDPGMVRISVTDTGMGISIEQQRNLFSAFQQADSSTTRKFGGTGLGLVITRSLARMMGGDVALTSEPGVGTTFTLTFAATTPDTPSACTPETGEAHQDQAILRGCRILIVDDTAVNRMVVRAFLKAHNVDVSEAENGVEALEYLRTSPPFDVVLLDGHMPLMDGPETIKHIRDAGEPWSDVPVIAFTADAMEGDRQRYLALGMNGYLPKPVVGDELTRELARVLAQSQATPASTPRVSDRKE